VANPQLGSGGWYIRPNFQQQFNSSTIQQSTMTKTCPRCGKTFECVHSIDCWCVKVKLTDATKAYLKEHYSDCLCKDCLEEINGK
jgi:hypothetical protein